MFKLSVSSKAVYDTLHTDLQLIIDKALMWSTTDFGLSEGYRSPEKQFEYYKRGRSKIGDEWHVIDKRKVITYVDGYIKKSKHNHKPSLAFDFFVAIPNRRDLMYNRDHLILIATTFINIAAVLYDRGEIKHEIRWGGNFDRDEIIISDQNFVDLPHIELYKPN